MKRRILAMLLAIVMLVGNVPVQAFATESEPQETTPCAVEGCTYGAGHSGECSTFVACTVEGCTFALDHEGNCSNYVAPEEPKADPAADAAVYVTVSDRGELGVAYEEVTVSDINADGKLSVDEALYAAHTVYGKGYASQEGTVTQLWGVETTNVSFFVNDAVISMDVNTETISAGDYLVASVDQDTVNDYDKYSRFDVLETSVKAGEAFTLKLTDDAGNALAGMEIGLSNGNGTTTMTGLTTDVDGSVTLTLAQEGLYCVTAKGSVVESAIDVNTMEVTSFEAPIIAPVCVVTVTGSTEQEPSTVYAEKEAVISSFAAATLAAAAAETDGITIETDHAAETATDRFITTIVLQGVEGTAAGADYSWTVELAEDTDMTQPITFEMTASLGSNVQANAANLYLWANSTHSEASLGTANPGTVTILPEWDNGQATVTVGTGPASKLNGDIYTLKLSVKGQVTEDLNTLNTIEIGETKTYKLFAKEFVISKDVVVVNSVVSGTNFTSGTKDHAATIDVELAQRPEAPFDLTMNMTKSGSTYVSVNGGDRVKFDSGAYTIPIDLTTGNEYILVTYSTKTIRTVGGTYTINFTYPGGDQNMAPTLKDSSVTGEEKNLYVGQTYTLDLESLFKDVNGDDLTYTVQVNEADPVPANPSYAFPLEQAGDYTLVFRASDGTDTSEDSYTAKLTVAGNTAPYLIGEASGSDTVGQYSTWTIDLSTIFEDDENNGVTYTVSVDGAAAASTSAEYSYAAETEGDHTFVFQAKDNAGAVSPKYTLTLKVNYVPRQTIDTNCTGSGNGDTWVKSITITGAEVVTHAWNVTSGHTESDEHVLSIQLSDKTPVDAVIDLAYTAAYAASSYKGSISGPASVTLEDGKASVTVTTTGWMSSGTPRTYILNFTNTSNSAPVASETTADVSLETGGEYTVDLSEIFSDPDGEELTYTVTTGGETVATGSTFSQVISTSGEHVFVFTAADPWNATATYTVTITASQSTTTYDASFRVPEGITPGFYVTGSFDGENGDSLGDALTATAGATENGFTTYTVAVPESSSRISFRGTDANGVSWGGMTVAVSQGMEPVTLIQLLGVIPSRISGAYVTAEQALFQLVDKDGCYAVSGGTQTDGYGIVNYRFLAVAWGTDDLSKSYTTYVVPQGDLTSSYVTTIGDNKTFVKDQPQQTTQLSLTLKSAFTVTAPTGATVQVFQQRNYYNSPEIRPVESTADAETGMTTWLFEKGDSYRMSYRVSMEDKITKAGYVNGDSLTVTWDESDDSPNSRTEYDTSTLYGSRGDDSLVLNVNGQNHLVMHTGDNFRLRAYRIWEVINSDTNNITIQPDMYYTLSGDSIVSITPVTSGNGNGKNNWLDLTATGSGVAYLEVGYDAMNIVTGNMSSYGGDALDGFTFNAVDPARTGLVVIQVGNAATDVNFGIQSSSKLGSSGVPWDVEFDTLYFTGDKGQLTLAPSVASGAISTVEISGNKGASWTALTASEGIYTADIVPGNNILRVTKTDGTQAYQVVRGDRITVSVTQTSGNGDSIVDPGESFRIQLHGVHNPIGKMSGNYNPGYGAGQHVAYAFNGSTVTTSKLYQYDFVSNAWVDVTIPADAKAGASYQLSDGYISFNVYGITDFTNNTANHRGVGDSGCNTRGTDNTNHQRGILPEITLTVGRRTDGTDPTVAVEGVTLDQTELTMTMGDEPVQLTATVSPTNATNKTVTWSSSNAAVATAVDGLVTPVGPGTATITAKAGEKEAACTVTVEEPAEPVSVKVSFAAQAAGEFLAPPQLELTVYSNMAEGFGYNDQTNMATQVSTIDVLVAAHVAHYGAAFTMDNAKTYLATDGNFITVMFGQNNSGNICLLVNSLQPGTNEYKLGVEQAAVVDGDLVEVFVYQNVAFTDKYIWLELPDGTKVDGQTVYGGKTATVVAKGRAPFSYGYEGDAGDTVISGAEIYMVDITTGKLTTLGVTTGTDGTASITVPESFVGKTVYLAAKGKEMAMTLAKVTVEQAPVSTACNLSALEIAVGGNSVDNASVQTLTPAFDGALTEYSTSILDYESDKNNRFVWLKVSAPEGTTVTAKCGKSNTATLVSGEWAVLQVQGGYFYAPTYSGPLTPGTYNEVMITVAKEGEENKVYTVTVPMQPDISNRSLTWKSDLADAIYYTRNTESASLSVEAQYNNRPLENEDAITYQWYSAATASAEDGTAIEGATAAAYSPKVTELGTSYYYVTASCKELEPITSNVIAVTVTDEAAPTSVSIVCDYPYTMPNDWSKALGGVSYVAKAGDTLQLKAVDQNGKETPVVWLNTTISGGTLDKTTGVYTVKNASYSYIQVASLYDANIKSEEKVIEVKDYSISQYNKTPSVTLAADGQSFPKITGQGGIDTYTMWEYTPSDENIAELISDLSKKPYRLEFTAMRPGTIDVSFDLDLNGDNKGDGSGQTDSAKLSINGIAVEDADGKLTKTYLETSSAAPNPTVQLTALSSTENASFTWSSADETVATVDENGMVTAQGIGSVIISAKDGTYTGGIKVVVTSADTPYFEQIDFATTTTWNTGLSNATWKTANFKPTTLEYTGLKLTKAAASTLTLNATTLYNTEKYTAAATYTDVNGEAQSVTINSGAVTEIKDIPFETSTITITLTDKTDAARKTAYTFEITRPRDTVKTIASGGIVFAPDGREIWKDKYNSKTEGIMYVANEDGSFAQYQGVSSSRLYYRTYAMNALEAFALAIKGTSAYSHIRFSTDNGTSWTYLGQIGASGVSTGKITIPEPTGTENSVVKVMIQILDDVTYAANVAAEKDGFADAKPNTYTVWVEQIPQLSVECDILTAVTDRGDWYPTFDKSRTSYRLVVDPGEEAPTLTFTASKGAVVTIGGEAQTPNEKGEYTITLESASKSVIVASSDGTTEKTYSFGYGQRTSDALPDKVTDYLLINGQYVNGNGGGYGINPQQTLTGGLLSLGNFGGYVTFYYEDGLTDSANHPYGVDFYINGNAFNDTSTGSGLGSMEPGQVWVSEDGSDWYALAGSEHYEEDTLWDYAVTYSRTETGGIAWKDNRGNTHASTHGRSFAWPSADIYTMNDLPTRESFTLSGILIPCVDGSITGTDAFTSFSSGARFGYVDTFINGTANPYLDNSEYQNASTGFDLAWAVDSAGDLLDVSGKSFHYVKVVTASNIIAGAANEKSTEVSDVVRATAGTAAVGVTAAPTGITFTSGEENHTVNFESGKQTYEVTIPTDMTEATILVNGTSEGDNIYINNQRVASGTASAAFQFSTDSQKLVRIIVQNGEKEPVIYLLKIKCGDVQPEKPKLDFGLEESEILGYVTVSFVDNGIRAVSELPNMDAQYKTPLGTIVEPTQVPFKAYDTIAAVTLRLLDAMDISASYSGNADSGFYLSSIGNFTVGETTYASFGEFDAGSGSGWMITQNDVFINKGASEFNVKEGDSIEWQYTCQLGADIGDTGSQKEVDEVERLIADIGTVTLDSEDAVKAAREAYEALSPVQQKQVENYETLTTAEAALALQKAAEADKAAAKAVADKIEAIGEVTEESKDDIEAARAAYDALTDAQKALVTNYEELEAAEETLELLNRVDADIANIYKTTGDYLAGKTLGSGTTNGEWAALGLARSGRDVADSYYEAAAAYVKENISNGRLHDVKSTENSRLILALTAIGKDVTDVDGYNLLSGLNDLTYIGKQGVNGLIYALIALDSHDYTPVGVTRDALVEEILAKQLADGGWSLGSTSEVDLTAMAIQALAPYYSDASVKAAVDKALTWLSNAQNQDGSFSTTDGSNAESIAQVIVALTALDIDPDTDTRFIKTGITAVQALAQFYAEGGGFEHIEGTGRDDMATEQGYYALAAYARFKVGQTALYDMSDVTLDKDAAAEVEARINAIGTVDLSKEDEIDAARTAYDALTDAQKALVTNYKTLTDAETALAQLKQTAADTEAANAVKALIDAIGTVTSTGQAGEIEAARRAYNALTTLQKNLVGAEYLNKLEAAEDALDALEKAEEDEAAAQRVENLISSIGSNITLGSESKINTARNAYNALTADQKALVSNYQTLLNAEAALNTLKSTVSVTFSLLGCYKHGTGETTVHTLAGGNLQTWIKAKTYRVQPGATVKDLFEQALRAAGMTWSNPSGNYIESITKNGVKIGEFTNGKNSGWMYTLNGRHPGLGVKQQTLVSGDVVVFHYTDDYTKEEGSTSSSGTATGSTTTSGTTNYITTTTTTVNTETAESVDRLIEDIGEEITLDSEAKITAARAAYDKLTEAQKKLVEKYEDLVAAEAMLAQLKGTSVENVYITTGDYIQSLGTPGVGTIGGEWMVIGLARSGRSVPSGYYDHVLNYVRENINDAQQLHSAKSSDNSRLILALTAIGKDVTNVDGHDLLKGLNDMDYIQKQGINGPIWALMAFDSGNYPVPEGNVSREALIDVILEAQLSDGGWALSGERSDPDMTGMAIQALAPYMESNMDVKKAVEEAVWTLSELQNDNGSYTSVDGPNSESIAQVIVALAALGIDADTDARFVKNGISAMDALLTYYIPGGGFRHVLDGNLDGMATEQAYYAMVAYNRMKQDQNFLYDMTDVIDMGGDVIAEETTEPTEAPTEPAEEDTDDGNAIVIWMSVAAICAIAIAAVLLGRKKFFKI